MAKFHLSLRLARRGLRVRMIIVDYCNYDPELWRACVKKYDGLETFFDEVEVASGFDRGETLPVHPDDAFIATTWWTAHIAHAAVQHLGRKEFIYLIQEYEPYTLPMGSYYALASQSYEFPHRALFSTRFVLEHFRQEQIGVFADGVEASPHALYFENALTVSDVDGQTMRQRKTSVVCCSTRAPNRSAARNMFELALARARGSHRRPGFRRQTSGSFTASAPCRETSSLPGETC